jgi:WD40 repeat protein
LETLKPFPTDLKLIYRCQTRVLSIAWSNNGEILATGEKGGTLTLWEADTGKALTTIAHGGPIHSIVFNPVAPLLAYSCKNQIFVIAPDCLFPEGNEFRDMSVAPLKWVSWSLS